MADAKDNKTAGAANQDDKQAAAAKPAKAAKKIIKGVWKNALR